MTADRSRDGVDASRDPDAGGSDVGTTAPDTGASTDPIRVRGTIVESATPGGWCPDVDTRMATLETPISSLLTSELDITPGSNALANAEHITLVPDAHYPYHPSSGVVTDPAVVGAIVAMLERRTDAEITVAGRSDETMSVERTATYLGYESLLERFDAEFVDLATEGHTDTRVTVGDETVSALVPSRLTRETVVTVPSLRPTESGTIAGGLQTLAAMLEGGADETDAPAGSSVLAATRAIDPALSILDATTVYAGEPYAANALFAGPTAAVDAVGSSLLERSLEDDDVVRRALEGDSKRSAENTRQPTGNTRQSTGNTRQPTGNTRQSTGNSQQPTGNSSRNAADGRRTTADERREPDGTRPSITVTPVGVDPESFDLEGLRSALPTGDLPPADETPAAVTAAYRLYAAVSGDVVPPQLEGGE